MNHFPSLHYIKCYIVQSNCDSSAYLTKLYWKVFCSIEINSSVIWQIILKSALLCRNNQPRRFPHSSIIKEFGKLLCLVMPFFKGDLIAIFSPQLYIVCRSEESLDHLFLLLLFFWLWLYGIVNFKSRMLLPSSCIQMLLINFWGFGSTKRQKFCGIVYPSQFFGLFDCKPMLEYLKKILSRWFFMG